MQTKFIRAICRNYDRPNNETHNLSVDEVDSDSYRTVTRQSLSQGQNGRRSQPEPWLLENWDKAEINQS